MRDNITLEKMYRTIYCIMFYFLFANYDIVLLNYLNNISVNSSRLKFDIGVILKENQAQYSAS